MHIAIAGGLVWLTMLGAQTSAVVADVSECTSHTEYLQGADSAVLICGAAIGPATEITGLDAADIDMLYSQHLRHCEPHNRRPGFYLEVRSARPVSNAELQLWNPAGEVICVQEISLENGSSSAAPDFLNVMTESDAKYVDVNGIRTRYFEQGDGPALLLVHGGQPSAADFNAWDWQQNFAGLAENFRVIALDRVGQGYTDNPAELDEYANYYPLVVEHLYGFMQALNLKRVHLVGHSQGGWPAARTALDHPDKVASLTVVDSTMVAPASNAANAVRFYIWHQNDLHPPAGPTVESIRRGMRSFSYTNRNITDQRVARILAISATQKFAVARDWFNANQMSPAHPSFRALKAKIWEELEAGALQVPALIIWGREDPEGSFGAGVAFYKTLLEAGADVSFRAFEKSGHVPYMEYPAEFNAVLTEFAQENP